MDSSKCARFLVELRKEHNLTQQQLADIVFVTRESVSKWERGVNLPDHQSLLLLSRTYGITVNEILYGEYKTKHNEEQVNNTIIEVMRHEESLRIRIIRISLFVIIFILAIVFVAYFIANYNSIKLYVISGESKNYQLQQGTIITFKDKIYIQFGDLRSGAGEEIENVTLYFMDNDEEHIISSTNELHQLNGEIDKDELFAKYSINQIISNLYIRISSDDKVEDIKIVIQLDHANSTLFPSLEKHYDTTKEASPAAAINILGSTNLLDKFTLIDGEYVYKTKNYTYIYDKDTSIISAGESIIYTTDIGILKINGNVICDIHGNYVDDPECKNYAEEITTIHKELFE